MLREKGIEVRNCAPEAKHRRRAALPSPRRARNGSGGELAAPSWRALPRSLSSTERQGEVGAGERGWVRAGERVRIGAVFQNWTAPREVARVFARVWIPLVTFPARNRGAALQHFARRTARRYPLAHGRASRSSNFVSGEIPSSRRAG